jgi:hypothetical protein
MISKLLELDIRISPETHKEIKDSLDKVERRKIGFRR